MGSIDAKALNQIAPGLCIRGRESRDASRRLVEAGADVKVGPVTKDAREAVLRGHEPEALIQKCLLVRSEKAGAREHRQVHRANIVAKARQRELLSLDCAACRRFGFDDRHRPSFFGEPNGRREPIVPGSDHHGVIGRHGASTLKAPAPRRRGNSMRFQTFRS